ncbi:MAG: aminoacyl--tRNA ligase-related protein [Candidatus Andersenbacteria bacterium]
MLGDLALLHDALVRFAVDELTQKGYTPILPPTLVSDETMYGAGMFPVDEQDVYRLPKDGLNLAGTSEISVLGFHAHDTLNLKKGPTKYVAYSTCYRREAGAAGKDQRGIIRMHQFDKVEMFTFAPEDASWDLLDNELVPLAEGILSKLGLHFRRVTLCTGDLARKNQKTYDLECWLPSEERYVETNSISNVGSFQARRLGIKYVAADGSRRYVHTLNGTAMAFSRLPSCILEQCQTADGKVRVPEVLQPYLGNREYLG